MLMCHNLIGVSDDTLFIDDFVRRNSDIIKKSIIVYTP